MHGLNKMDEYDLKIEFRNFPPNHHSCYYLYSKEIKKNDVFILLNFEITFFLITFLSFWESGLKMTDGQMIGIWFEKEHWSCWSFSYIYFYNIQWTLSFIFFLVCILWYFLVKYLRYDYFYMIFYFSFTRQWKRWILM